MDTRVSTTAKKTAHRAQTPAKTKAKTAECRIEHERAVWTAMHDFVTARPAHYARVCDAVSLTSPQAALLRVMTPDTPYPMSALATALACHASNVTGLVDRLEEQGLVVRRASEEDRRVKHILLTPKGVTQRERLCSALYAAPPELARLTEEELSTLEALLNQIAVTD